MLIKDLSNNEFVWNSTQNLQLLKARRLVIKVMEIWNFDLLPFTLNNDELKKMWVAWDSNSGPAG